MEFCSKCGEKLSGEEICSNCGFSLSKKDISKEGSIKQTLLILLAINFVLAIIVSFTPYFTVNAIFAKVTIGLVDQDIGFLAIIILLAFFGVPLLFYFLDRDKESIRYNMIFIFEIIGVISSFILIMTQISVKNEYTNMEDLQSDFFSFDFSELVKFNVAFYANIVLIVVALYSLLFLYNNLEKVNIVEQMKDKLLNTNIKDVEVKSIDKYIIIISSSFMFCLFLIDIILHRFTANYLRIGNFDIVPFHFSINVSDMMWIMTESSFNLMLKIILSLDFLTRLIGTILISLSIILIFFNKNIAKTLFLFVCVMLAVFNIIDFLYNLSYLTNEYFTVGYLIGNTYRILLFSLVFYFLKKK